MSFLNLFCCTAASETPENVPSDRLVHSPLPANNQGFKQNFKDKYRVDKKLGEGGFAVVHLAFDKETACKVAVKIVTRRNLDAKDERALDLEYQILHKLSHPNIVSAYDYFKESDNLYVVLEYLDGGELFDRIVKKSTYTEQEARDVVETLLRALKFCHDRDIVHRDLKPENLLLVSQDDDANVKLADFGLATIASGNTIRDKAGTPEYIAPEIIENIPFGKAVDMWAFGVIVFILIGGYQPFHDDNRKALFRKIISGDYKFHPKRWSNVSDDAKDFIRKLLNINYETRITVDQALAHQWIGLPSRELSQRCIDTSELRKFQAAKKLRVGVKALMAVSKFKASTAPSSEKVENSSVDPSDVVVDGTSEKA
jgi:calcium/calmodulin-dependent protein kinase I